jgi:tRNA (cmo5U34)-methyltransferase
MDKPVLEKMSQFFASRIEEYDRHMLNKVEGCHEGYIKMAELIPNDTETLLDLGCGTGLELEEIFKRFPDIAVVGIDLSSVMLDKLKEKFPSKNIRLICGNYFKVPLGQKVFDAAVSFQTMHHFSHSEKTELYNRIHKALKPEGVYIESDYMVTEQSVEDHFFAEYARIRKEMNLPDDEFYHFDTPCTVDNQITMLKKAGFQSCDMVWRKGNTTIIVAKK